VWDFAGEGVMGQDFFPDITTVSEPDSVSFPGSRTEFAYLVMIYGEYLGRRYSIEERPLIIGRSPDCDIQLTDDCVSRVHCRVTPANTGIIISDLDSTNGTYIDGDSVTARSLRDGDRIKIGRSIFKFLTGDNIEHAYHEEIYRLKTTDGLTGAYNKRYFEEDLERELFRFFRYKRPLSLLMIDIDLFKKVNDEYGHLAGDRVLTLLGQIISKDVRREDTFCRYGGEEFAILMPEMGLQDAILLAERIRKLIADTKFEFEGYEIPVTISLGAAEADMGMNGPEDFVRVADERLYAAKEKGRNCVEPLFVPTEPNT
jgi:diguanylate cyclase (GGDEF)-like protein